MKKAFAITHINTENRIKSAINSYSTQLKPKMAKPKTDFERLTEGVIGNIKGKGNAEKWASKYQRIGGLSVRLLRKYLRRLNEDDIIGVYSKKRKKELVPLHCRGKCLAPIVFSYFHEREQDEREFKGV